MISDTLLEECFERYRQEAFYPLSKGGRGNCSTALCKGEPQWMTVSKTADGRSHHRAYCRPCAESAVRSIANLND